MLFATESLAGLTSSTMVSRLGRVLKGYRVKIVHPEPVEDARDITFFVDESYPEYEPSPDEIELI